MADATTLEDRARDWIAPYSQARHLVRTLDWLLELEPAADEAMRLAALTHDMERHFPGGPVQDRSDAAWDDPAYLAAHSERSARIVGDWLREQNAPDELVLDVEGLIELHEVGGTERADLLQAADSISFLDSLADLAAGWVRDGVCSPEQAKAKHRYMLERIRVPEGRRLAEPQYEQAIAALDREAAGAGVPATKGERT